MNKKYVGILLMLLGIAIIITSIFMRYDGYVQEKKMIDVFEKHIENSGDENKNVEKAIGIMEISKIGLKVAIGEGVDQDTLKYAVGHFSNTPYPGEKGNCSIAGHRSYTYSEHFNRLDEIVEGDKIKINTQKGSFSYSVYKKYVVLPKEVSVLNDTPDAELTLITCTPLRVATHRLIIKAKLE